MCINNKEISPFEYNRNKIFLLISESFSIFATTLTLNIGTIVAKKGRVQEIHHSLL